MLYGKHKIWYIEYDEDGNEIGRGVYNREYVRYGMARRVAHERYGDRKRYKYRIAPRDPWMNYNAILTCEVCGSEFVVEETLHGYSVRNSISIGAGNTLDNYTHDDFTACPDCIKKVRKYIDILKRGDVCNVDL